MKSFFDKTLNNSFSTSKMTYLLYFLKYKDKLSNKSFGHVWFEEIKPRYYCKLKEIIMNCDSFNIDAHNLYHLPKNIINENLTLDVRFSDPDYRYMLPKTWKVKEINCYYEYDEIILV
jgi:hypothetical protein